MTGSGKMGEMERPASKASLCMDGMELELIIQELQHGIRRATFKKDPFRAALLKMLLQKIKAAKQDFHRQWSEFLAREFREKAE